MNVLSFTTIFPSPAEPRHGLFVCERLRHARKLADIRVVAPVCWRRTQRGPRTARRAGLPVSYPPFWYVPGIGKCLDGVFLFLCALPTLRRLRRESNFDLIDAHFTYPDGFAAILLGWWFRRPTVITMRGNELEYQKYFWRRAAMGWALRRSSQVVTVSAELGHLAERLGVPRRRIRVIPNGVDSNRFRIIDRGLARQSLGIPHDISLVVSVGRLVHGKGFHRLIAAFDQCRDIGPTVHLAIVGEAVRGSGSYASGLQRQVRQMGLQERVRFVGPAEPDEIATWLNAADVFVLASDREGCPNVVIEALACGCPVVTTDVGEAAALLAGTGGIVVRQLGSVPALGRAIAQALTVKWDRHLVRDTVRDRTWEQVATRVAECWEDTLEAGGSLRVEMLLDNHSADGDGASRTAVPRHPVASSLDK